MIRIAFCIIAMLVMVAMLTVVVYAQHIANKDEDDEEKSDIPYDTPQIMCGVSGIYSRLADIEHKLRKENKNGRS